MLWYLVRRHLNYSIAEWERLSWVDQLVYLEGLQEEFYDPNRESDGDDSWDDLAGIGVKVRHE